MLIENFSPDVLERNPELMPKDLVSIQRGLDDAKAGRVSKYHNVPTEFAGRKYPSKKHAKVAQDFYTGLKQGKYKGILEEIPFRLPGGVKHRVDFGIIELNDVVTWYEVKGRDLALGKLKRKQVEELFHIKINVI